MKRSTTDIVRPSGRSQRKVAYDFVLEALDELRPTTRPLFGSTAVYVGEKVLFILRKKGDTDDGVWVAFDEEREADAMAALPSLERIKRLPNVRCWRKLAASSPGFEQDVLEACRLAHGSGGPLGKVPVRQKAKARYTVSARTETKTGAKKKSARAIKKRAKKRGSA